MTNEEFKNAVKLTIPREFDAEFYRRVKANKTQIQAYTEVEALYFQVFERFKYASFDSYRVARNKRLKKKCVNKC